MKYKKEARYKLLLAFMLCFCFVRAQNNWNPVHPSLKYNYHYNNSLIVSNTIWLDSTKTIDNDTVAFLNTIVSYCDTCSRSLTSDPYDTTFVLTGQPQFLQRRLVKKGNGIYQFLDTGNVVIHVYEPINNTWLFDSTNNISASILSKNSQSVFSFTDSIITIRLSCGDTILMSKSYGILQYPGFYGSHQYYKLSGIEGLNLGEQVPNFHDFFNFSINDVFQYRFSHYDYNFFPPLLNNGIKKITILNKWQLQDTIRYQVQLIQLDSTTVGGGSAGYNYTSSIKLINYVDSVQHFCNLYNKQNVDLSVFFPNASTKFINQIHFSNDSLSFFCKSMGMNCYDNGIQDNSVYGAATLLDSIHPDLNVILYEEVYFGRKAAVGLGITSDIQEEFSTVNINCLIGYYKGIDTVGTIYTDAQLTQIAALKGTSSDINIVLFPNPTKNNVQIKFGSIFSGRIDIIDVLGKVQLSKRIENTLTENISITNLNDGIYTMRFLNEKGTINKKIIIEN